MLIRFKVGNFRSYEGMQEFSMIAGVTRRNKDHVSDKKDVRILKNAAIFGANASGKSNIIKAMEFSQIVIQTSLRGMLDIKKNYCRTSEENSKSPSYFEYMIETAGSIYSYGFEAVLSEERIVCEWLYESFPGSDKTVMIFERGRDTTADKESFEFCNSFSKDDKNKLNVYMSDMQGRSDILFLTEMSRKNFGNNNRLDVFHKVYNWFVQNLFINRIPMHTKSSVNGIGPLMGSFDTDIANIGFREMDVSDVQRVPPTIRAGYENTLRTAHDIGGLDLMILPNGLCIELTEDNNIKMLRTVTSHHSSDEAFDIMEESTGTLELFAKMSMLTSEADDVTYVMDEFGNALHPQLAFRFVKVFQKHNAKKNNQLIITTHTSSLLTLDAFRRDEIWFVQKDSGISELFSLDEFQNRFDTNLDKAYKDGRYGAIPRFDDVFPPEDPE